MHCMTKASTPRARIALYRKYRPTKLDDVIGQPQVTDILRQSIASGEFSHAYLFTGQRGTGKTTVARILARLINGTPYTDQQNDVDIIEIDAASNNGVDDVRDIRDTAQLSPMMGKYKVYIIDEFHMLSRAAFNALLKIIEEPPQHVVFILATTELQKVPATILSRVQRFQFKPVSNQLVAGHLRSIAAKESIEITDEALELIARAGGGSVRDAITMLDQLSSAPNIDADYISLMLGWATPTAIAEIVDNVVSDRDSNILLNVRQLLDSGITPDILARQIIDEIMRRPERQRQLFELVNNLLDVGKYTASDIKLMAIIGLHTAHSLPAAMTPDVQSAPKIKQQSSRLSSNEKPQPIPAKSELKSDTSIKADSKPTKAPTATVLANDSFAWDEVLNMADMLDLPSIRALLTQAEHRFNNKTNTLTLFFEREFYRKQANGNLFRDDIARLIKKVGGENIVVEISKTGVPLDSDVAAVLDVVGGEVTKYDIQ